MKKYSSYFNKRYFPEPEDAAEEEGSLSNDSLSQDDPFGEDGFAEMEIPVVSSMEEIPVSVKPVAPAKPPVMETDMNSDDDFATSFNIAPPEPEKPPKPNSATDSEKVASQSSYELPNLSSASASETEATIISKSAIINGELTVTGDIHMFGKIKGNLTATGNLEIAGKVIGNVSGVDIELSRCELKGDVNASGFVYMDRESVMIGNMNSQDITVDGKVKGDVSASHKVYVRSNAVIVGNVRAGIIAIDEGAALQGQVIIANKSAESLNIAEENQAP